MGLGKVGSPMAACMAAKGHRVVGFDPNPEVVDRLNAGASPVFEPGLKEMLAQAKGCLTATTDLAVAVSQAALTFVIVPTPSRPDGAFSMAFALAAAEALGRALANKPGYHLTVLNSTVMPGYTTNLFIPALEKGAGKKCPAELGVCYSPEMVALGSVIRDFLNPDFLLIGESDARAGDRLAAFYATVLENQPAVQRMSPVNAELTKLAVNTYLTMKLSYANLLAQLCQQLDGGNVDVVTGALALDSRIGPKYLRGGVSYGGPCFPRDNVALASLCRRLGVDACLAEATDRLNLSHVRRLKDLVRTHLPTRGRVGVLGLAYKAGTTVVERSPGLELAQAFLGEGVPVVAYDPLAMEVARAHLVGPVEFAESARDCARRSDLLVICTPDPEFQTVLPGDVARPGGRTVVIDCWRLLDGAGFAAQTKYIAIGINGVGSAPTPP
jgi:UDPglucose 6-dehydrogenase